MNLYTYVMSSPTNYVDPLGLLGASVPFNTRIPGINPWPGSWPGGWNGPLLPNCDPKDSCMKCAKPVYDQAGVAAKGSGLPGPLNGEQDAFRHCVGSCGIAQKCGNGCAAALGWGNELPPKFGWPDSGMDIINNKKGREAASSPLGCYSACMLMLLEGNLVVLKPQLPNIRPWQPKLFDETPPNNTTFPLVSVPLIPREALLFTMPLTR